jgi:uncharacterized protein YegP (UPF0339 family)
MAGTARYEITKNKKGQYLFTLYASNGQELVKSDPYASKDGAKKGIEALKNAVEKAEIKEVE